MAIGTVKWFNTKKGYGFIAPEGGDKDVFVHISALEKAGLHSLDEGQKVEYELQQNQVVPGGEEGQDTNMKALSRARDSRVMEQFRNLMDDDYL